MLEVVDLAYACDANQGNVDGEKCLFHGVSQWRFWNSLRPLKVVRSILDGMMERNEGVLDGCFVTALRASG